MAGIGCFRSRNSSSATMASGPPDVMANQEPAEVQEECSGKKKSKFQSFKKLFARKKRKEAAGAEAGMKSSQSSDNVSKTSEENTLTRSEKETGSGSKISLGNKALSHDSVFVSSDSEANEALGASQDSIHGKVKSLQLQLKQAIRLGSPPSLMCVKKMEDAGTTSEDDGLPCSPPEYTSPHAAMKHTHSNSAISLEGEGGDNAQFPGASSSRGVSPLVAPGDFSQPASPLACLDNSAAKHKLGLRNKACNRRKPVRKLELKTEGEDVMDGMLDTSGSEPKEEPEQEKAEVVSLEELKLGFTREVEEEKDKDEEDTEEGEKEEEEEEEEGPSEHSRKSLLRYSQESEEEEDSESEVEQDISHKLGTSCPPEPADEDSPSPDTLHLSSPSSASSSVNSPRASPEPPAGPREYLLDPLSAAYESLEDRVENEVVQKEEEEEEFQETSEKEEEEEEESFLQEVLSSLKTPLVSCPISIETEEVILKLKEQTRKEEEEAVEAKDQEEEEEEEEEERSEVEEPFSYQSHNTFTQEEEEEVEGGGFTPSCQEELVPTEQKTKSDDEAEEQPEEEEEGKEEEFDEPRVDDHAEEEEAAEEDETEEQEPEEESSTATRKSEIQAQGVKVDEESEKEQEEEEEEEEEEEAALELQTEQEFDEEQWESRETNDEEEVDVQQVSLRVEEMEEEDEAEEEEEEEPRETVCDAAEGETEVPGSSGGADGGEGDNAADETKQSDEDEEDEDEIPSLPCDQRPDEVMENTEVSEVAEESVEVNAEEEPEQETQEVDVDESEEEVLGKDSVCETKPTEEEETEATEETVSPARLPSLTPTDSHCTPPSPEGGAVSPPLSPTRSGTTTVHINLVSPSSEKPPPVFQQHPPVAETVETAEKEETRSTDEAQTVASVVGEGPAPVEDAVRQTPSRSEQSKARFTIAPAWQRSHSLTPPSSPPPCVTPVSPTLAEFKGEEWETAAAAGKESAVRAEPVSSPQVDVVLSPGRARNSGSSAVKPQGTVPLPPPSSRPQSSAAADTEESCVRAEGNPDSPFGVRLRKTSASHLFSSEEENTESAPESPLQPTAPKAEPPQTVAVKPTLNPSVSHRPVVPKKPEMHGDGGKTKLLSDPAAARGGPVGSDSPSWISVAKQKQKIYQEKSLDVTLKKEEQEKKPSLPLQASRENSSKTLESTGKVTLPAVKETKRDLPPPTPVPAQPSKVHLLPCAVPPKPYVPPSTTKSAEHRSRPGPTPVPVPQKPNSCTNPLSPPKPVTATTSPTSPKTLQPQSTAISPASFSLVTAPEKSGSRAAAASPQRGLTSPPLPQDEPPWMALAKKKAKAWSEMPQIVQ